MKTNVVAGVRPANSYRVTGYFRDPLWVRVARALIGEELMPVNHSARRIKWRDTISNLVTTEGKNDLLTNQFKNGTQSATWYLGLTNASPTADPSDTMASHPGWTENTNYSEANRVTWVSGTVAGGSLDNSASTATFSIDTNGQTIGGSFLVDENTKGGATGTLYAVGAFSGGNKSLDSGETIDVTATMSIT